MTFGSRKDGGFQHQKSGWTRRVLGCKAQFGLSLLGLTGGFVTGNLTGSHLNFFRSAGIWDGFILIVSLAGLEGLNYLGSRVPADDHGARPVVTFKLGLLLGTFTDAFKVGS